MLFQKRQEMSLSMIRPVEYSIEIPLQMSQKNEGIFIDCNLEELGRR